MKQRIKVIGITGGIASGKSTIAEMLESLGADLIDADKICHELINTKDIALEITKRWGNHLKNNHGKIKREELAEIVFSDRKEVSALNRIIHPKAIKQIRSRIAKLHVEAATKAIVLDAALLVESNLIDICDIVLFVNTEKDRCKTRVQNSRKWPLDEIEKREKFQNLLPQKREVSDVIINNNQSKEDTLNQVKGFWCQFITKK
ncbi:MAG: dephospho-CoA kinase [Candidatus Scalindua sp.]|jgi:dephospho-CoA kinase|nr:dephospho-CoA kinase [Candidatus Scalindua sp.]MBT5305587.1 dephospho-CoA kinase [Candidatus Scalindua sp.]MBT6047613.1 dephospho-CoA kinase [Candidatus Scalindua sp.]MBT6231511.1 dephospho-CoA kinase [Candidatus Scalindua sp.]MBT6565009.1 dephospho-CoA kinase [Candidatus Scalindua sp.]